MFTSALTDSGVTCAHLLFLILRFMFTSALDSTIGSMLGMESTENRVYAYDNDMETLRVSVDFGVTWSAADDSALAEDRLTDWLDAMEVPLEASLDLDVLIPTAMYTSTDWGGKDFSVCHTIYNAIIYFTNTCTSAICGQESLNE